MKVLISAYACEPGKGSEPGVGWNWPLQAARHGHEVHVITRANNEPSISAFLRNEPVADLSFHYYDLPAALRWLKKRTGYYGMLAYYYLWQIGSSRLARRLHRKHRFDLAHHVTFVNDWMPSGVAWVGIPFIWGPIGGSTNVIPMGRRDLIPSGWLRYELTRRATQQLLGRLDPFVAYTRRRASVILTFTRHALDGIPKKHRHKARPIVHIGVDPSELPPPPAGAATDRPFTVASGSRLVHWKGFDLLIEGFALFRERSGSEAQLRITGTGPFRSELERVIVERRIGDHVTLLGQLPSRDDVYRHIMEADLFALPTLRDGPPVAIIEAMLSGKPILCLDTGSTAELVPDTVGLKIPVMNRTQVVEGIAEGLGWAAGHRGDLREMGERARAYALEKHDWNHIGDEIGALYACIEREPL